MANRFVNLASAPGYLDPGLKVGWAKHHLRLLDVKMGEFLNGEKHAVLAHDDLEAGEYVLTIQDEPINIEMCLIVGDWAACIRGSLDHLATHLTYAPKGSPNERASFPIVEKWNSPGRETFNRSVSGIPPEAIKVIDSFQPYHSGDAYKATKLWRLNQLWNIDKHRRIPFHAAVSQVQIGHPPDVPPLAGWADDRGVVRFPLSAKDQINFDPSVKLRVEFGDKKEGVIIPYEELIEIHNFVRNEVMPPFQRFF